MPGYNTRKLTTFALEPAPRISRAQSMDVLSSQSNLAGYRAVIEAAHAYGKALPMMMMAAGTVPPAKVMIMGAGVAGLQAIATAKRLGAVVCATDVRLAAKEQVESLGGKFVMVADDEAKQAETSGGYAKEMSEAYKLKQAALIADTIKGQDIVITTALIPGRKAPAPVTEEMVQSMKPGSALLDMAVEFGRACKPAPYRRSGRGELCVKVLGVANCPPGSRRMLFSCWPARSRFPHPDGGQGEQVPKPNFEDEIVEALPDARGGHRSPSFIPADKGAAA